jgi:hypothetical protein
VTTNTLPDWHLRDRQLASEEALRLASVRDDLTVRYRLGLATFNAASIVALLTAMGTASNALTKIGFTEGSVRVSLVCFCFGVVAAGISIASYQNDLVERAGYAAARVAVFDRLISIASDPMHPAGNDAYERAHKENQDLFEKGLRLRHVALWGQSLSAGAWFGGVLVPILALLGWK